MSRLPALAALLLALLGLPAGAWPVDVVVPLEPGTPLIRPLSALEWVEVEAPEVVEAEVLPGSGELLLVGRKPGTSLLLLYAEGRFAVWRLVVGEGGRLPARPQAPEGLQAARAACPGLEARLPASPEEPRRLVAQVTQEPCRRALGALLTTDAFLARELELTFALPALQAQLAALEAALTRARLPVVARYQGAGLVLVGEVSEAQRRQALWAAFRTSVGKVALEDRLTVPAPPPTEPALPQRP